MQNQQFGGTPKYLTVLIVVVASLLVLGLASLISRRGIEQARLFVYDQPNEEPATTNCPTGTPVERGIQALELIKYPWRNLNYTVEFLYGKPGYLAITNTGTKHIKLFVRPCQFVDELANTLAHEFGHAVDDRYNTEADRAQIQLFRGYSTSRAWFGCNGCTDFATPAGDFAEVFAFMHGPPGRFKSKLNGPPGSPEQRAAMEQFFQ